MPLLKAFGHLQGFSYIQRFNYFYFHFPENFRLKSLSLTKISIQCHVKLKICRHGHQFSLFSKFKALNGELKLKVFTVNY